MNSSPEYLYSEKPTLEELQALGWQYLPGCLEGQAIPTDPQVTERESFKEILIKPRLQTALKRINLTDDGEPWLDDYQIESAISQLERAITTEKLIEANQLITELLWKGVTVSVPNGKDEKVQFIDFENLEQNDFLAVNQYRVDPPSSNGRNFSIPDIVLFVNGIPLVVIECKSPTLQNPLTDAIEDLLKYSNQRHSEQSEGIEKLFHYNLMMVAMSQHRAVVRAVCAKQDEYLAWQEVYPATPESIAQTFGVEKLRGDRQTLVAGLLKPDIVLDVLHNFTLFTTHTGKLEKVLPRYLQYRAILKAIARLQNNPTRQDHSDDQRGGIVWHTQGSGKSLSMVYLIRKMRRTPNLKRFKIVMVTDRTDLEKQLSATVNLTQEPLQIAKNVKQLNRYLAQPGAGLVFGMVQKFRGDDEEPQDLEEFIPEHLNDSPEILVMIDEAHRSHASTLHMNLMKALPNCAKIGFTGTPIVAAKKKKTAEIFGGWIDQYTIKEFQADGVTLRILYEGLEARATVANGETLDRLFEVIFRDKSEAERGKIKQKYATRGEVGEAKELIAAKAKEMLQHYIRHILPNGFKVQVVASSRRAAIRYHEAFSVALQDLIQKVENQRSILQSLDDEAIASLDEETQYLAYCARHLDALRTLETAVIISGDKEDPPDWQHWTSQTNQDQYIERFKKPLAEDGLAFLIVKSMLLTGFNAPIEQAMYIDRNLVEHELLQAIARVNRPYDGKDYGLIVDYYGIKIDEALAMYNVEDLIDSHFDLSTELPKLEDQSRRVLSIFAESQTDISDVEACLQLLDDQRLRVKFTESLKVFLETLDLILPRPAAAPYIPIAKKLGLIRKSLADLYRDEHLDLVGARAKVRELIDSYIQTQGIDPKTPPVDILSLEFQQHVNQRQSTRTQAAEMEHAARHHISVHFDEDPVYYKNLSERLEEILQKYSDNWTKEPPSLSNILKTSETADRQMTQA
jgi:type I restriction enzyme R subunit